MVVQILNLGRALRVLDAAPDQEGVTLSRHKELSVLRNGNVFSVPVHVPFSQLLELLVCGLSVGYFSKMVGVVKASIVEPERTPIRENDVLPEEKDVALPDVTRTLYVVQN